MNQSKLNIETELRNLWHSVVTKNVNQIIAHFRQDLTRMEVNFSRKIIPKEHPKAYECEVICKHRTQSILSYACINRDGGQAVIDAVSRLKRKLIRIKNTS